MTAAPDTAAVRAGIRRDGATWFAYLLLGYFTYNATNLGNIIPFMRAELGLSYAVVSLHASAIASGLLIVGLVADRVIARVGRRRALIASALGSATGVVGLALAPTAVVSVPSCFLIGLLGAFIPAITSALLSDIHGAGRDIALAEANAVSYAFAVAAPLLVALTVATDMSWRLVPLVGVVAAVVIVVTCWRAKVPDGAPLAKAGAKAPLPPAYWAYWALLGLGVALEFSGLLWAPSYLERVVGLSPSMAALGAASFFVAMFVGRTVGIGLVRRYAVRPIFFGMVALVAVGFVVYWLVPWPPLAVAGLFTMGLGIALFFPMTISLAMGNVGLAGSDRGSSRAMLAPAIAFLFNPPLLGALADSAGLWFAQVMVPVFLALALAAFLTGQRLEQR